MEKKDESCGWSSDLPTFHQTPAAQVIDRLNGFVRDAGNAQHRAWQTHVPAIQGQCRELANHDSLAPSYTTILEYELPYDLRRVDLVVLERAAVVVAELKGYRGFTQGAIDQLLGYTRDLHAYHAACATRVLIPILITAAASRSAPTNHLGVRICHPADLHEVLAEVAVAHPGDSLPAEQFVRPGVYVPLPTIVQAARQLFETRELPYIRRAHSATKPALQAITDIAHQAAEEGTRHLVLLSGIPGSGKTLVGLQLVHARWLDDLAECRGRAEPSAAGVYLSGNGPLVRVLQDALKDAGGAGRTFVRRIKDYVNYYTRRNTGAPPEHLIVFDEAQRAHDAQRVAHVHKSEAGLSEPEHLLQFCERIPRWSVLVALIGTGQAIHAGEEGGVPLWRKAVDGVRDSQQWTVHCGGNLAEHFNGGSFSLRVTPRLNLDTELRFHLAKDVHRFVDGLLTDENTEMLRGLAARLFASDFRLWVTRDVEAGKLYLQERYRKAPLARYGLVASSKDKILPRFNVDNTYQATERLRVEAWYNAEPTDPRSCCQLNSVATEFSCQGLELDFALLAWGSDLRRTGGCWSDDRSGGYRDPVRDRLALRKNAYRVLLTRGRDGSIVFVPRTPDLEDTWAHLLACGFRELP